MTEPGGATGADTGGGARAARRRAPVRLAPRPWVRLDNASNIFPAARSAIDPKVFRLGAEMDADVDPALLQEALDETFDRYPLYHAVPRRGVFWHYLQDSPLHPVVAPEREHPCAPIHDPRRPRLLFRVVHHRRRIGLEVFHALSDGTGALWFLTDLLDAYARRLEGGPTPAPEGSSSPPPVQDPAARASDAGASTGEAGPPREPSAAHDLVADSFAHHFRRRRGRKDPVIAGPAADAPTAGAPTAGAPPAAAPPADAFARAAAPAALTVAEQAPDAPEPPPCPAAEERRVLRVRGTPTPDARPRCVELTMPAAGVLALAKQERVSMTMLLTALFLVAVHRTHGGPGRPRTLAVSVPVNLRQFFPSTSARNFFATIRLAHRMAGPDEDPGAVARALEESFRPQTAPDVLAVRLRSLIRYERSPALRVIPRPLKDLILRIVNARTNRRLTIAVSNLGRVVLPEPAESRVRRMTFQVSAVRPQFCAISHGGELTITFTSPFVETAHVREMTRMLTARGIDVSVAATRVTEAELQQDGA